MFEQNDPFGFRELHKCHETKRGEFEKLFIDSSCHVPKVGDRVVIAAGLIGRGHDWVREGATVLECGESSVRVRFDPDDPDDSDGTADESWIHPALVTDVLVDYPAA